MGLTGTILDQLDQIGDWGLLATDAKLVVTRWNRWLEQRSGLSTSEVVGRALFDVFPDMINRRMDRYYQQVLTGQTVLLSQRLHKYVIPLPPTHDTGGVQHLQQTSRIVPLMEGNVACGTLTIVEDVTERVAYEAELRARARQQAHIAAVARSALGGQDLSALATDLIAHVRETLDADFVEIHEFLPTENAWKPLARTGWTSEVGISVTTAAAPRTHPVLSTDNTTTSWEVSATLRDADPFLKAHGVMGGLLVRVPGPSAPFGLMGIYTRYPRQFSPGEVLFAQALGDVLGVAVERKRLEGELRLHAQELSEADQRKDEFLAMLAHELRNPLAPVRNGLQILRTKCAGDAFVERLVVMMTRQVAHLVRLVDDLLDISRVTRGKVTLRKETVTLSAIVMQAIEEVRPLIEARHHELHVTISPTPIYLHADLLRLTQVLGNLINNAAKYTEDRGHIWIEARQQGEEAIVSVRDSGVGISAEMLPRVFDLFTQVDRTLDRSQGGLGIGLSLVRSLTELHGGSVRASSAGPGRGSEFVIRLPAIVANVPVRSEPPAAPKIEPVPSARQRILIVDDNSDSADSLAMLLDLAGHDVKTVYEGITALEAAETHRPDLILLDIGLPGINGYEVASRLRNNPKLAGVKLVALTGYGQEDDRRKTLLAGFDLHLVKPVDPNDLYQILNEMRQAR